MTFSLAKSVSVSTVLVSVAIVTFQPAFAETKTKIQPIIQTNYNNINAAFLSKDIKRATAYFTPDYVSISPKGERQGSTFPEGV